MANKAGEALPASATAEIRDRLPAVADAVVRAIIDDVPAYADAFAGPMGQTIRQAVQVALGGFLSLADGRRRGRGRSTGDATSPRAPAVQGAYQLGRGEARSGRSTEALLSAYRIGARVAWQEMADGAVRAGLDAAATARFAGLVFAYIDELSAASAAGHADESETTGRVRQRRRERLVQHLMAEADVEVLLAAAERADWAPPTTLTAVVMPESQVRPVLPSLPEATLRTPEVPGLDAAAGVVLLLVPDHQGRRRGSLLRALEGRAAVVGPPRPWAEARWSAARAVRARTLGLDGDTDAHLPALVLTADADALADLRAAALAPLADLADSRPAAAEKLTETLRAWLLHQGRRDDVAAALFVHPQTVRYRLGQLRDAFGDGLEDPEQVLRLTLALGVTPDARPAGPTPE